MAIAVNKIVGDQYITYVYTDSTHKQVVSISICKDSMFSILHNENGPAFITYHANNVIANEGYYVNGFCQRDGDLPAHINYNDDGTKQYEIWYKKHHEHREHGPSYIRYINGVITMMRWKQCGRYHNEHGPAFVDRAETKKPRQYYFINDTKINKPKFLKQYLPKQYEDYVQNKTYAIGDKRYKIRSTHNDGKLITLEEV